MFKFLKKFFYIKKKGVSKARPLGLRKDARVSVDILNLLSSKGLFFQVKDFPDSIIVERFFTEMLGNTIRYTVFCTNDITITIDVDKKGTIKGILLGHTFDTIIPENDYEWSEWLNSMMHQNTFSITNDDNIEKEYSMVYVMHNKDSFLKKTSVFGRGEEDVNEYAIIRFYEDDFTAFINISIAVELTQFDIKFL